MAQVIREWAAVWHASFVAAKSGGDVPRTHGRCKFDPSWSGYLLLIVCRCLLLHQPVKFDPLFFIYILGYLTFGGVVDTQRLLAIINSYYRRQVMSSPRIWIRWKIGTFKRARYYYDSALSIIYGTDSSLITRLPQSSWPNSSVKNGALLKFKP
jgi:hypothetical protein